MTQPPRRRRQVAAANDFVKAVLDNGELCPKIGVQGTQEYLCRFRKDHRGECYWYLMGARPQGEATLPTCEHYGCDNVPHACIECERACKDGTWRTTHLCEYHYAGLGKNVRNPRYFRQGVLGGYEPEVTGHE